ncbi:MAG: Wzz/FepE/Etk N-terminal domain-containing protein [Sphingobium sp.]
MVMVHALKVLRLRWKILISCAAFGLGLAAAYILIANPVYKSVASVVVDVRAPETIGQQQIIGQTSPEYLLTQEDILKSERVAKKVIENTGLAQTPGIAKQFGWRPEDGSVSDFLAGEIGRQMRVQPSLTNSRVMEIGFFSGDPKFAADMANAFAQAFIDVNISMQAEPARRAADSYEKLLAKAAENLKTSQAHLASLQRKYNVPSTSKDSNTEALGLASLTAAEMSAKTQAMIASSQASMGALPAATADAVVMGLDAQLAGKRSEKARMELTLGPNNAQLKQIINEIRTLESQRAARVKSVQDSSRIAAAQANRSQTSIANEVAQQKQRAIQSQDAQNELTQAELDNINNEKAYDQLVSRKIQRESESAAAQTNISLLTSALPPVHPIAPRPVFSIMVGLLGGLITGFLVTLAYEMYDLKIRNPDELEAWLGITNLGAVRAIETPRAFLPRPIAGLLPQSGRG